MLASESPLPPTSGFRLRTLHLARQLSQITEVELAVLGPAPAMADEGFEITSVGSARPRMQALLRSATQPYLASKLDRSPFAPIVGSRRWGTVQAELSVLVPPEGRDRPPVVLNAHNVESELVATFADLETRPLMRARWRWEVAKTRRHEAAVVRSLDGACATSDLDASALERLGARRIVVVPNGVSTDDVAFCSASGSHLVAYVGHFGYRPNASAALELIDGVLPRLRQLVPDAAALLVGRDPTPEMRRRAGPTVQVTGEVTDVLPHLRLAGALVVPLRAGSGTRLKVLEAMSAGVPVVSTPFGATGIDAVDGRELLLGETAEELAAAAARLLGDAPLAARLAAAARRLVVDRYDWRVVARPLLQLHADLGAVP